MLVKKHSEIIIAILFLVAMFFALDPFDWYMPSMAEMMFLVFLVVVFAIFSVFVWREGKGDERQVMHRMLAGRLAFLAGMTVLIIAIVVQSLAHQLDHWLIITLGVMVIAKLGGLLYGERKL